MADISRRHFLWTVGAVVAGGGVQVPGSWAGTTDSILAGRQVDHAAAGSRVWNAQTGSQRRDHADILRRVPLHRLHRDAAAR